MFKVVIVEDETLIRKGIRYGVDYAKLDCVVVAEAEDGVGAIETIFHHNPDIVIMDINLPIIDGLEVLKRTNHLNYSAIILTGQAEFKLAQQAINLKVIKYLLKPLDIMEYQTAIEEAKKQQLTNQTMISLEQQRKQLSDLDLLASIRLTTDQLVKDMIVYVEKHYAQKITIQQLVEHFGYSETHLTNKFKKHTQLTFNTYLNRYRISKAIELMNDHIFDINILADQCGFSDYKYFDKVFQKYIGCTVKAYQTLMTTQ